MGGDVGRGVPALASASTPVTQQLSTWDEREWQSNFWRPSQVVREITANQKSKTPNSDNSLMTLLQLFNYTEPSENKLYQVLTLYFVQTKVQTILIFCTKYLAFARAVSQHKLAKLRKCVSRVYPKLTGKLLVKKFGPS